MRLSEHPLTKPGVQSASPTSARVPAAACPALLAAAAVAAIGSVAVLLVSMTPLQTAVPWIAAGTAVAAGTVLLLVFAGRRPREAGRPAAHSPAPSAIDGTRDGMADDPVPTAGGHADGEDATPLVLQRQLAAAAERFRTQQIEVMDDRAELAGAIVHDMNNALGAVAGYADFLTADLPPGSPQADYAARILTAVDRARLALHRLMATARPGPVELRTERASRVLDMAATLLRGEHAAGGLTVCDEAGAPDPRCDAGLLARTLAGLATDVAVGVGGEGRHLVLRASGRTVREGSTAVEGDEAGEEGWLVRTPLMPPAGLHVVFELRIDGPPPPPEELSALTDPLLAARARHRRRHGKRSEGESSPETTQVAALQAARLHGGGLILRSHPSGGTLVQLYVPAVASAPRRPSAPPERCVAPTIRVLVVESDHGCGDRFQTGLEQHGCEVSVCDDPRDALEAVADEPAFFDAIVIGPGFGLSGGAASAGRALATRLKALRSDLPCVLYAAGSDAGRPLPLSSSAVPADIVLPLPVDLPRLARGVAALAAGRSDGQPGTDRSGAGRSGTGRPDDDRGRR
ncbi:hypothetical protein [Azospirillum picis]|uniref:histidine kinase n=1 Tax=Azospirillum picis TaxID=488438 RepID=A0ABU0MDH3_9PROT|nr:hypothetical protein [Azospirillum picis]MBP2297520.1 signal transduction histidine kinase [Azospirillum picis]MDQ0531457.1 signal transduction histidine kinase [Azospirillum picis]